MEHLPEYAKLINHTRRASTLASCAALLSWDQQTYMPKKGGKHRSEQLALLAGMIHDLRTAPEIEEWLSACENSSVANTQHSKSAANIRELRHAYNRSVKVPKLLMEELAIKRSNAYPAWEEARQSSNFNTLKPHLKSIVKLMREYADAIGYEESPYDALLDGYEPGLKTSEVEALFSELRDDLMPLVNEVIASDYQPDKGVLKHPFSTDRQRIFAEIVASMLGFDFKAGRLDIVAHPFSVGIGPGDSRITTRWNNNNIESGLFSVMHEVGHALYEQGLNENSWGIPTGSPCSFSINESQARLWENCIGRSLSFWEYFFPLLQTIFPGTLDDVQLNTFVHALNAVQYSFMRIGSDEVTYNLHIIQRFELEVALITGELDVADLPEAWNVKFKKLFKLQVPDDTSGCLQDAHWSDGDFGYFPTYTLGNLYAAQFFAYAQQNIPDLNTNISHGNFKPLLQWLRQNIYKYGAQYRSKELIKKVTGESLNHNYLLTYLQDRYAFRNFSISPGN